MPKICADDPFEVLQCFGNAWKHRAIHVEHSFGLLNGIARSSIVVAHALFKLGSCLVSKDIVEDIPMTMFVVSPV
jgi:hypothetical protein